MLTLRNKKIYRKIFKFGAGLVNRSELARCANKIEKEFFRHGTEYTKQ